MNMRFMPAKLLLAFVEAGRGTSLVEATKCGGARGGTRLYGRGLLDGESAPAGVGAEYARQDIVLTLMLNETEKVMEAVKEEAARNTKASHGTALVLEVPQTLIRPSVVCDHGAGKPNDKECAMNSSGFKMIISITNHGEAEALMSVARQAGARGGTIVNAMGTGTEDDLKYFGISLVPEKELLIIICENSRAEVILQALGSQPVFSEPGGGIVFCIAVEHCLSLGNAACQAWPR